MSKLDQTTEVWVGRVFNKLTVDREILDIFNHI